MADTLARPEAPWALRLVPPFPAIAHRIIALVSRDSVGIHEVGELVQMDPSFSAELLRYANSALFSSRGEIKSLHQAIMLVGLDRLRTMATMVAVNRMIRGSLRLAALRKVWVHSIATAFITEEAARINFVPREAAYTLGLLHNLGTLGLMSAYQQEYSRMLEVSNDFGFDLLRTEENLFDIDHCAAGAYLARDWHFPEEMAVAISTHHQPPLPEDRSLENLIRIGWRLADTLGYAAFSPDRSWPYQEIIEYLPNAVSSWLGESPAAAKAAIDKRLASAPV